jgi:hypothetical protein
MRIPIDDRGPQIAQAALRHDGLTLILVAIPLAAVYFIAVRFFPKPDKHFQSYSYGRYLGAKTFRWVLLALGIAGIFLFFLNS